MRARPSQPFIIRNLVYNDIINFKENSLVKGLVKPHGWQTNPDWNCDLFQIGTKIKKRKTTSNKVPWSEGVWFRIEKLQPQFLFVRDGYESCWPWKKYQSKLSTVAVEQPSLCYTTPPQISSELQSDLQKLIRKGLVSSRLEFVLSVWICKVCKREYNETECSWVECPICKDHYCADCVPLRNFKCEFCAAV